MLEQLGPLFYVLRAVQGIAFALAAGVTSALAFGAATNFMPIFVRARHIPSVAAFFMPYVVAAIAVRLVAGGFGDRFGYRRVGLISLTAFGGFVCSFALAGSTPVLVLLAFGFGIAHGWAYPSLNALFVTDAPEAARGRAMALFNLSFNVGVTCAAFAGGEIAERFGYSAMWLAMGALSLFGVVALALDRAAS
jgi:MFS family permease